MTLQQRQQKTVGLYSKIEFTIEKGICRIILRVLQGGFQELYRFDERVAEEMNQWEDHMIYGLECPQGGPSLYLQWRKDPIVFDLNMPKRRLKRKDKTSGQGKLVRVKNPKPTYHDVVIRFTSMHMAFLVLTGQIGISGAYALHGFTLKGDIMKTMSFSRCVDVIEAYLFPKFMTKRIMTDVPKKNQPSLFVYTKIVKNILLRG